MCLRSPPLPLFPETFSDPPTDIELRAAGGDTVWQWQTVDPRHHADPLVPMQVTFDELRVSVQQSGRYDLVLLTGDDEIARQPLLIGPADVLRG